MTLLMFGAIALGVGAFVALTALLVGYGVRKIGDRYADCITEDHEMIHRSPL